MTSNFLSDFQQVEFPKLGYIKIPKYLASPEEVTRLSLKGGATSYEFLLALVEEGLKKRLADGLFPEAKLQAYKDRASFELETYNRFYFVDYILLIYGVIKFCKKNNILNSPSRGSCAGSLILYLIGVTSIDPIRYELLFERFISGARTEIKEFDGDMYVASASMPDVDIDSDVMYKPLINKYLSEQFPDKTCKIINLSTLGSKIAIKECGKIIDGIKEEEATMVSSRIENLFGVNDTILATYEKNEDFRSWCDAHPRTYQTAQKIEGLIKHKSIHASAIFISDRDLGGYIPTELSSDGHVATSYDMHQCALLGIKVDNLGLKNLGAIRHCLDLIGKKIEDIDVNDPEIYTYLNLTNSYVGIFQCEDGLGKQVLQKIKPNCIDEINLAISMSRPGCYKFVDEYVRRKVTQDFSIDPRLDSILRPTLGIITYQEQLMKLSMTMGGFSPVEANEIRSAVGKKNMAKMMLYKDKFIKQSIANNYPETFVKEIWQVFEDSGSYLFCAGHGAGYGALTAITTYLKAKHTKEYYLSLLKYSHCEADPIGEISTIQKEMSNFNLKLLPPHLQKSEIDFSIEDQNIRFGLSSIKGVSGKTIEKLLKFKATNLNKLEMFEAAKEAGLTIGVLSALIQAGALEEYKKSRVKTVYEAQLWNVLMAKEKVKILQYAPTFNFDLVKTLRHFTTLKDEKGRLLIKETRVDTIRKNSQKNKLIFEQNILCEDFANWWYENKLLGYASSCKLIDIFRSKIEGLVEIGLIEDRPINSRVNYIGKISGDVKKGISKAKGSRYATFIVSDETGSMKTMIFNDRLDECESLNTRLPKEDDIVIVKGSKKEGAIFADVVAIQQNKIYTKLSDFKSQE